MKCEMCSSTDISLLKLLADIDHNTMNIIAYVLPDFVIGDSQDPVFICLMCLEEVASSLAVKKTCLDNLRRLSKYHDILKNDSESIKTDLKVLITSEEVYSQRNEGIEFKMNSGSEDLVLSEYQDDSISTYLFASQKQQFKCSYCPKTFIMRSKLEAHARVHIEKLLYNCPTCQKTFTRLDSLSTHKLIHTGEKPYKCDVCHKTFISRPYLKGHKLIHTGEKPYECEVCHKTFTQLGHLNRHKLIHTGEKPYECEVCHKTFTQLANLNEHIFTHTGEKPYECDICHISFTNRNNLVRHKRFHKV